jgi:hypothetical protein
MKNISRTVAMILIMVMLACSYTGCRSIDSGWDIFELTLKIASGVLIGGMILIVLMIFADAGSSEKYVYLAGAGDSPLEIELSLLKEKFALLPEADIIALTQTINSLSEKEYDYLTQTVNSMSDKDLIALMKSVNTAKESELVASLRKINSMSEAELATLVKEIYAKYYSPKMKVASSTKTESSMYKMEYVSVADFSLLNAYVPTSLSVLRVKYNSIKKHIDKSANQHLTGL